MRLSDGFATLDDLLRHCCDCTSEKYRDAWTTFYDLFSGAIHGYVVRNCSRFQIPRLKRQLEAAVEDIEGEVLATLCRNKFRALVNFRERHSVPAFRSFLAVMCRFTTLRYLRKAFPDWLTNVDASEVFTFFNSCDDNGYSKWIRYNELVALLRGDNPKEKGKQERNIHIFMLYRWSGFKKEEINSHPYLRDINPHLVDVEAGRLKKILQRYIDDLF